MARELNTFFRLKKIRVVLFSVKKLCYLSEFQTILISNEI